MKEKLKCPYCGDDDIGESVVKDFYCNDCGKHFEDYTRYKTGTFIMNRCTVIILKDKSDFWQMIISGTDFTPSYKEVIQARYKYLADDIVMAQIFPTKKDFDLIPENAHYLKQLTK